MDQTCIDNDNRMIQLAKIVSMRKTHSNIVKSNLMTGAVIQARVFLHCAVGETHARHHSVGKRAQREWNDSIGFSMAL